MTRITCPSCAAIYEVPHSVIPPGGRDVKCARCGHDWFQLWAPPVGPDGASPQAAGASLGFSEAPQSVMDTLSNMPGSFNRWRDEVARPLPSAPPPAPEPAPAPDDFRFGAPDPGAALFDDEPELDLPEPPKRRIDPEVLAVLRSEAAVETEARRKETGPDIVPPPSPLPRRTGGDVRARLAALQDAERHGGSAWAANADGRDDTPEEDLEAPADPVGFRPLPPIATPPPAARPANASTAPHTPSKAGLPAKQVARDLAILQEQQMRKGFRIGFLTPVLAASVALIAYLQGPALAELVPEAAPWIEAFVASGDQVQARLAESILAAFERLGATGGS